MTDETTNPRRTPDLSAPDEQESKAPDVESTQVIGHAEPTSELPSVAPEAPEELEAPEGPETPTAPETTTARDTEDTADTAGSLATSAPAPPFAPVAPVSAASPAVSTPGGLVTVRTGPRPGAILLGLLCLLVAAYTTARQTTDWRLDLDLVGPVSIGAMGALLLLVGLIGMVSRRRS